MTFTQSISTCFGKYATFSGRATRSEFWWLVAIFAGGWTMLQLTPLAGLSGLVWLVFILPSLAVAVRRLHDGGSTGALLIPVFFLQIGSLYFYMFTILFSVFPDMLAIEIDETMTLAEFSAVQREALTGIEPDFWGVGALMAAVISAAGILWAVYLFTRPSQSGPNSYGPPSQEVFV